MNPNKEKPCLLIVSLVDMAFLILAPLLKNQFIAVDLSQQSLLLADCSLFFMTLRP